MKPPSRLSLRALGLALALAGAHDALAQPPATPCAEPPKLAFAEAHARFADAHQYAEVVHRFAFANLGERPVEIQDLLAVAGDAEMTVEPEVLAPGAAGEVVVRQSLGHRLGRTALRYALFTDEPCVDRYRFTLSGFVESAYDPERPALEFGLVDRAAGASVELELGSREVDRLVLREANGAPAWLTVEEAGRAGVAGESLRLVARIAPGAPLGWHSGTLRLVTGVAHQPWLEVAYRANVFATVTPSVNPIDLGLVRQGEALTGVVDLRRRGGGEPPGVTGVTAGGTAAALTWSAAPCPAEPACTRLFLTVPGTEVGAVAGRAEVAVAGAGTLPLELGGRVVLPGTEVRPLTLPEVDPAAEGEPRPLPTPRTPAAPSADTEPGGRPSATLRWTVRDEKALRGYHVYRADRREGPFRRVSATMVPVPEDGAGEHSYVFVDDTVEPCRTYYYFLDYVTQNGLKVRFSGVGAKVVACPEGAEERSR